MHPHRFRHTFATWAIEQQAREIDVQKHQDQGLVTGPFPGAGVTVAEGPLYVVCRERLNDLLRDLDVLDQIWRS